MLDMGFAPQLNEIAQFLPEKRQSCLFTATTSPKIKKLSQRYLVAPAEITVGAASKPVAAIQQKALEVHFKDKDERVLDELNMRKGSVIIFLRTKHRTDRLTKYLDSYGLKVGHIHGGRTQGQRNRALRDFRNGKIRILCATDVAARGIDCLLYTSPSPRDRQKSRMPSSA